MFVLLKVMWPVLPMPLQHASVSGFILHCSVALLDSQYAAQAVASLAGKEDV